MATFDPRYASVPNAWALLPIGQQSLANAWNSGWLTATSSTFPTAMPSKTPVAVPKDTRDYSKDVSKTPGMSANMPTLGFGGMTTFPQYSPETMSMTSRKVLESAAKIKQAQQSQNAQLPQQQATQQTQVTPEEIASAKANKRLTKRHVDYVVSLNPGTDPVTIVKGLISKGYAIEWLNAPVSEPQEPSAPNQQAREQPPEAWRSMTFLESMWKSAKSIVGGAGVVAGSIPKVVWGVVDLGEELLGGWDGIGEKIKWAGEALQEKSLDYAGIEWSGTRWAAKFVSDVGLPIGGLLSGGMKAIQGTSLAQKTAGIIWKVPWAGTVAKAATSPYWKAAGAGALYTAMTPGADLGDIATWAAVSAAFPLAGKALKPAKELLTGIIGTSTGKWKAAIETAWASKSKPAFQETQNLEKIAESMKSGVRDIKANRKAMYGTAYDVFEEQSKKLGKVATDDVMKMADDAFDEFLKVKAVINRKTKKAAIRKSRDLSMQVTDEAEKKMLSWVYKEIYGYRKWATMEQLQSLKWFVDSAMKGAQKWTKTYWALERIKDGITTKLEGLSPVYKGMNENYSRLSTAIEDIEKTLSLGGNANTQTAITKLSQILKDKQNDEFKRNMVRQLERLSGDKDMMARLASASLDNWLPEGLARVWLGTAAGWAAWYVLSGWDVQSTPLKMFLGMLVLGSPKWHKLLATTVWKSTSWISNLAKKYQKVVKLAKKTPWITKKAVETAEKVWWAVKWAIKNVNMSTPKAASAIPRSMVEPENEESSYQGIINRR